MAFETQAAQEWLFRRLKDDNVLACLVTGIYRDIAPQSAKFPYLVFNLQASTDENSAGARTLSRATFQIKIISENGSQDDTADDVLARLETLLNFARGTQDSVRFSVKSVGVISYTEPGDGKRYYRHQGRLWRFDMSDN